MGLKYSRRKNQMAKKVQAQAMKDAYGANFSQQDLTVAQENQVPQPLMTATSKTGGVELLASVAKNRLVQFAKRKKIQ